MAKLTANHRSSILNPPNIEDRPNLTAFLRKRAHWFELFEGTKPKNVTVQRQLMDAIVLDLTYRVFAQESSLQKQGEGYAVPSLRYLLNFGYVISQAMAARRLLDSRGDVASLSRILKEIKSSRKLMTRENFVSYDGTPYDSDIRGLLGDEQLALQYQIFGPEAPAFASQLRSLHRHERFDSLSGTSNASRSRTDLIHQSIFKTLESWLLTPEAVRLKKISDNRFAHASDGSHYSFKEVDDDLALLEVENAHRGFILTSRAIFDVVLNSEVNSDVVPMLSLGSFGTVWADTGMIESTSRMQDHWDKLVKERNEWVLGVDEKLYAGMFGTSSMNN